MSRRRPALGQRSVDRRGPREPSAVESWPLAGPAGASGRRRADRRRPLACRASRRRGSAACARRSRPCGARFAGLDCGEPCSFVEADLFEHRVRACACRRRSPGPLRGLLPPASAARAGARRSSWRTCRSTVALVNTELRAVHASRATGSACAGDRAGRLAAAATCGGRSATARSRCSCGRGAASAGPASGSRARRGSGSRR